MRKRPLPISADRVEAESLDNDAVTGPTQPAAEHTALLNAIRLCVSYIESDIEGIDDWTPPELIEARRVLGEKP